MTYSIKFLTLIIIGFYTIEMKAQDTIEIIYKPIGIFKTQYTTKTSAPRQGIHVPNGTGTIELYSQYHKALNTLQLFEYISFISFR